jgi:hypothetical protein
MGKGDNRIWIETEHKVLKFRKWLPKGPTLEGGYREKDIIQFIARDGGVRTVLAEDLVVLR